MQLNKNNDCFRSMNKKRVSVSIPVQVVEKENNTNFKCPLRILHVSLKTDDRQIKKKKSEMTEQNIPLEKNGS